MSFKLVEREKRENNSTYLMTSNSIWRCALETSKREITKEDLEYCRNALDKAVVPYPRSAIWIQDGKWVGRTVDKEGEDAYDNPSLLEGMN